MEPLLEIQGLSKAFGGLQALWDFHLTVNKGEIVGIIGPNGAGKTTLFNLITGFLRPDSGEVRFRGERISHLKPHQIVNRGISRTFQLVDLFQEMTVLENIMVPCYSHRARIQRKKGEKPWEIALGLLKEMDLLHRTEELAKNLAFGELRMLDIARAMATEPDLLLLDEPFSGLDTEDAEILSAIIRRMHEQGQTMIIIEHRLRDLMRLVERVVAIVFGRKVAEGTPEEILNNEEVVKAYLGEEGEE
jgi:branched-chain amino acid transport system ATP-binding protein